MWWILVSILFVTLWVIWIRFQNYWIRKGVPQPPPDYFFLSTIIGAFSGKYAFTDAIQLLYNLFPNSRYYGFYQFATAALGIRDPNLIKEITVKAFDHFTDHAVFIPEGADPLWDRNLFASKGKRWREFRSKVSPSFTSSKMKYMFSLLSESSEQFVQHFIEKNEKITTVELKDLYTRYGNDVIANVIFGIKCDSFKEPNNEFYLMGKETSNFFSGLKFLLKILGFSVMPQIFTILKTGLFSKQCREFFSNLVKNNIKIREEKKIVRPDMINILLEARKHGFQPDESNEEVEEFDKTSKTGKIEITDDDITGQAVGFFLAGFDTMSTALCFMTYELGVNQDIQKKLQKEIDDTSQKCNGKLTYDLLLNMKYMDMVVSETLRKWPPAVVVDRICTKPYTIAPITPKEKPIHLEKGAFISLPIYAIQRDPQYFPDPDRFDPERFSDENKNNIIPYSYIPFGSGPRSCVGNRFALLEIKAMFFHLLANFDVVPVEKTQIPFKINKKKFTLDAENGFWFGLKRRVECSKA